MYYFFILILASIFLIDSNVSPWLFIIVGPLLLIFIGFVVWVLIKSNKKRKEADQKQRHT